MSGQDEPEMGGDDEFEMRVESLRPQAADTPANAAVLSAEAPSPRRRGRSRVVILALCLVVLIAVVGAFALSPGGLGGALGSLEATLSSFSGSYPTPTLVRATPAEIGSAPLTCTPSTTALYTNNIGGSPVWVGSFQASMKGQATTYVGHSPYTRYGWKALVVFSVEPGVTGQIVMRGERQADGSPLWIGVLEPGQTYSYGDIGATPSVRAVLDTKKPGRPDIEDTGWMVWYGFLFIPAAGCYALDATWPGGSWRVTFAAGL